jgi:hypothetical protein
MKLHVLARINTNKIKDLLINYGENKFLKKHIRNIGMLHVTLLLRLSENEGFALFFKL